jgi:hypothetical protein
MAACRAKSSNLAPRTPGVLVGFDATRANLFSRSSKCNEWSPPLKQFGEHGLEVAERYVSLVTAGDSQLGIVDARGGSGGDTALMDPRTQWNAYVTSGSEGA